MAVNNLNKLKSKNVFVQKSCSNMTIDLGSSKLIVSAYTGASFYNGANNQAVIANSSIQVSNDKVNWITILNENQRGWAKSGSLYGFNSYNSKEKYQFVRNTYSTRNETGGGGIVTQILEAKITYID
ncbi:MAG: hypothetical protein RR766_07585 [Longicatena sp.]